MLMIKLASVLSVCSENYQLIEKIAIVVTVNPLLRLSSRKKSPSNRADRLGVFWMHVEISFVL